jgi:addiction module HigA family antidote
MDSTAKPIHPGAYVRQHVIPSNLTVKDAAKLLGVGRPALSNFLNGNSALSAEMAVRLERAFGTSQEKLFELQRLFDQDQQRSRDQNMAVSSYVPSFLSIKANQIQKWAEDNLESRSLLAVLLRKLIHSTGRELTCVDFPGYDNAERHGWDGFLQSDVATPWIPKGKSGWEFGCTKNPRTKAENDYRARTSQITLTERAEMAFVFATPHNWKDKKDWEKEKTEKAEWKSVRVLDASDLEQWLEQSIPAQIWLAEKLGMPTKGFRTLSECWERWALATTPNMSHSVFSTAVTAHRDALVDWLKQPRTRPLVIAAESKEEGLAFLACLFDDLEITKIPGSDVAAVFDSPEPLRLLASSSSKFLPIVHTEEAEQELVKVCGRSHCISIHRKGIGQAEADISLETLGHDEFEKAVASMGFEDDRAAKLARETGRSLTILRRRISNIAAIRTPQWATDPGKATALIPMVLIGTWRQSFPADQEIVSLVANDTYGHVEHALAALLKLDDSPVWSTGSFRAVTSKIDVLFAISGLITLENLENFFIAAQYVLSESDPALNLPEEKIWLAGIYGKVRDHSLELRRSICETLVILSIHGNYLFQERLGIDIESRVNCLIRDLLTPFGLDKLMSNDRDLPLYAEAAPETFLHLLEEDLKSTTPAIFGLMKPVNDAFFGRCWRSSILWSLECLAWKPQNLPRVTKILGALCRQKIEDNWMNKPDNSLKAIYRWWMPQTAASSDERIKSLKLLIKHFPDIGWEICIEQFTRHSRMGHHNYRPQWRTDGSGAGQPSSSAENVKFLQESLRIALDWPMHNEKTLSDLVERLSAIGSNEQLKVWDLIDQWCDTDPDESAKTILRETIRRFAFSRWSRRSKMSDETRSRAQIAFNRLTSDNPLIKHRWLFAKEWIGESYEDIEEEDLDLNRMTERTHKSRSEAIHEIWSHSGVEGVLQLISSIESPELVGRYISLCVTEKSECEELIKTFLKTTNEVSEKRRDSFIHGFLQMMSVDLRKDLLVTFAKKKSGIDRLIKILTLAPFTRETWSFVNEQGDSVKRQYWRNVSPAWGTYDASDRNEIIERLLEADRPRAAFFTANMDWKKVDTLHLKRLLRAIVKDKSEASDTYQLSSYDIAEAFTVLNERSDVTVEEMAQLEFQFISALDDSDYGIPNLERQFAESPRLFVHTVALSFKRHNGGEDPPELMIEDASRRESVAHACYNALNRISRLPGTDDETGQENLDVLHNWITETRKLLAECDRSAVGEQLIGQLLARNSAQTNGVWPSETVCEALERSESKDIAQGFQIEVYNSRGVHFRGEGGAQERELSSRYRTWAQHLAFEYPFVSTILEGIAASYDREADSEDTAAKVRKRLPG